MEKNSRKNRKKFLGKINKILGKSKKIFVKIEKNFPEK